MPAPTCVLFDFDGVLADTENIHIAAWERIFSSMGWEIPLELCSRSAELDDRQFLADVFRTRRVCGDLEGWALRKHQLALEMMREEPRLYPGVEELIHWLSRRCRLGIVSTARRETIATVLDARGLMPLFELVVSRESIGKPKPDPEPYLTALSQLRLDRKDVIAVEDSGPGVSSARAAGIHCLAIGHRQPYGEWCESATFLADFSSLDRTCEALGLVHETNPE